MNKTVTINISGIVFHIEEDAYEMLIQYMHEIKAYFSKSPEDTEVLTDIENRIAEMFSEMLSSGQREVILLKDVESMIAQIGRVSDFEEAAPEAEPSAETAVPRRLFRDPDDKKLGGVCAGISHYFGWDPVWLRIITAILAIATTGVIILIYVVLWLIMPQARTLSEKMAMKGERFHLSNFKRSFDEEMRGVGDSFSRLQQEVRNGGAGNSFKNFINELVDVIARIIRAVGKVLLPLIAVLLVIIGIFWLAGAFTGFFTLGSLENSEMSRYVPFNVLEPQHRSGFSWSVAGLLGIPALALILLGIRMLFNTRIINGPIGLGMLALWLVSLGFTIYYTTMTVSAFRQGASLRKVTDLQAGSGNTWYLQIDEYVDANALSPATRESLPGAADTSQANGNLTDTLRSGGRSFEGGRFSERGFRDWSGHRRAFWDEYDVDLDEWDGEMYEVELKIEQSHTGRASLVQVVSSRGSDFDNAVRNASNVSYGFSQEDSVLKFNRYFSLPPQSLWRAQRVDLTLQLPLNSTLIIEPRLRRILENHEIYSYDWDNVQSWTLTGEGLKPSNMLRSPQDTAGTF